MSQKPPVAPIDTTTQTLHDDTRRDDYAWLRDDKRKNPDVLAYLKAENDYAEGKMASTTDLQKAIFEEIKARTQETDLSVPFRYKGYFYYMRTEEGRQYPYYCRRKGSLEADEEVYLDHNALAEGHEFFELGSVETSPDNRLLAYSADVNGSEKYDLYIKDLETGELRGDRVEDVADVEWATDGRHLFYTLRDAARRAYRLYRHELGAPTDADELIYEENDEIYDVFVFRTRSDGFIVFGSESSTATEMHLLPADRPTEAARLVEPRQPEHEYYVEHRADRLYILTNDGARNFRVVTAPVDTPGRAHWEEILPHRPVVLVEDLDIFARHWVTIEREDGLRRIRVTDFRSGKAHSVDFPDETYHVVPSENAEFDTDSLRFVYQSFVAPPSVYDYDMNSKERTLLKRTEVLGDFDPADYRTERIFAPAHDGARVPISIVYRKSTPVDGSSPLILYGYGSYGLNMDARFSIPRLSLLDRGVVYAIAHIRGGSEMGKPWHDRGKMMHKRNSFTDFVACAEHLVDEGYGAEERIGAIGGSAGGLLMGAVVNMRPRLFRAILALVPFVDVLNTMLDSSLPLTVGEYLEWGNPNEPAAYHYMKTYCPYTNVLPQRYPAMLVTAGLHDPRVGYWEAAKWTARLRRLKRGDDLLLLKTNMGAGHRGASGRYSAWKEQAFEQAFLLDQLDAREPATQI